MHDLVERCSGLMVGVLDSGSTGLGSSPGQVIGVVFLDKTLNSHSASLQPVQELMGTGELSGKPDKIKYYTGPHSLSLFVK